MSMSGVRLRPGLLLLLVLASSVGAEVFRCEGGSAPRFQDRPCAGGHRLSIPAPHPSDAGAGLRPSERDWLQRRAKRRVPAPRRPQGSAPTGDRKAVQRRCWNRRRQLEEVRVHLRRGYKPTEGDRLRRRRRQYEDYLSRFCD